MGFNLESLLNEKSKEMSVDTERKIEGNIELVDIFKMIPSSENFYDTNKISDLVNSIKLVGLLDPLIITESDEEDDMFDIVSGHRRREACKYLVENEKLEKFRMVPCIVREKRDSVMDKLSLIMANRFRDKTDWEKMQECIQVESLINNLAGNKKLDKNTREALKDVLNIENDKELKVRDFVAEIMGLSATQVARYKAIYNNINIELMELFNADKISISIAYECSGLNHDNQNLCVEMFEKGLLTLDYVKQLKSKEKDKEPIKGQINFEEYKTVEEEVHETVVKKTVHDEPVKEHIKAKDISYTTNINDIKDHIESVFGVCRDISFPEDIIQLIDKEFASGESAGRGYISQSNIFDKMLPFTNDIVKVSKGSGGYMIYYIHIEEAECVPIYYFWKGYEEYYKWKWEKEKEEPVPVPVHVPPVIEKEAEIEEDVVKGQMRFNAVEEGTFALPEEREISLTLRQFGEIIYSNKPYLILNCEVHNNDTVVLREYYRNGLTGRYIKARVSNVERHVEGLEDGYCIILFRIMEKVLERKN